MTGKHQRGQPPLTIWFEFASTYSYLTVARAEEVLRTAGVEFAWRPFLLGPIFRERGMMDSPFNLDPLRGAYMWRDMERRAGRLGLDLQKPPVFPANGLLAARVMTAALDEAWAGDFARAVFAAEFAAARDISDPAVISACLGEVGADAQQWLGRAQDDTTKSALRAATDAAKAHGIFGAPSFSVGDEMFWGDDRLEDAIEWAQR